MKQNKQRNTYVYTVDAKRKITVDTLDKNWSVQRRVFCLEISLSRGKQHLTQSEQNTAKKTLRQDTSLQQNRKREREIDTKDLLSFGERN